MSDSSVLSIALWATNLGKPVDSMNAWIASVDACMERAAADGADLLLMPEYAAEQWLSYAPPDLALNDEIAWLAGQSSFALEALRELPTRHGIALLAGTMPVRVERGLDGEPPLVNRAHLLLPEGNVEHQDKLCLTPVERDPDGWHLSAGSTLRIVTWRGVRIVTLICLDIELPALAARIAAFDVDLVLVPSMTASLAGYNRVFCCARARATELLAAVCAVGCIGAVTRPRERPGSTSGAALYLPCERAFTSTGIAAEFPPIDRHDDRGPMLVVPDVPIARMRDLRRTGAEVWPGAWHGDHVSINEA